MLRHDIKSHGALMAHLTLRHDIWRPIGKTMAQTRAPWVFYHGAPIAQCAVPG